MTAPQLKRWSLWTAVNLWRTLMVSFGLLSFLTLGGSPACGQQLTCKPWNQVPEYKGTITVNGSGTMNQQGEVTTINQSATISIDAITNILSCDSFLTWPSQLNVTSVTYSINDTTTFPCIGGGSQSMTYQGAGTSSLGVIPYLYIAFAPGGGVFNFQANTYSVAISDAVPGQENVHACDGSVTPYSNVLFFGPINFNNNLWIYNIPLPASLGTLTGSTIVTSADMGNPPGLAWMISWNLKPVQNFDVIVTIPGYDAWRPSAGNVESDTGPGVDGQPGLLNLYAQLVDSTSGQPSTVVPDKVTFSLVDFSHEPGVSLNWPPASQAVSTPDLTFDPLFNPPSAGFTISPNGTSVDFDPSVAGITGAAAFLSPHDWGAWATLNVSMTVSGVSYPGHLQLASGQNVTDILIPKRQPGSHIADIWKTQHNVALSTPDDDDSEPDPSGYPGCVGDGFTLYEEYRGFMEHGRHIEGDPNSKDFFVENLIGADAEPGIWKFTQLTGLTVHKDIQRNEAKIDHPNGPFGSILINFNHSQGAHVTDQHGVTLVSQVLYPGSYKPLLGAVTILTVAGVHGKPRITDGVAIQYKDLPGTLNPQDTHRGAITPAGAAVQYDIGVAHELLHSVAVDHHGDNDAGLQFFVFLPPGTPENPTNSPTFQVNGQNVQLLPENGGPGVANTYWQSIQNIYSQCQTIVSSPLLYKTSVVDDCKAYLALVPIRALNNPWLYVGSPHQQHSGNDQCVMRYFFANAYPSVLSNSVYYLVPAGTEPLGNSICSTAEGTGVNDPDRTPQSRYSYPSPGRGGCQFWVCVSDNPNYPLVPK